VPQFVSTVRAMRPRAPRVGFAVCLVAAALGAGGARAADVAASAPAAISATIYRAPDRNGGSLDLNTLGGFALVTETRTVRLPAGESRLRFEGVVDGIIPESAIVTGLPGGVIEKNRDAAVLSPDALFRAALGSQVTLKRTNRKTGKSEVVPATIRSADAEGVVLETAQGVEALRCSGAPETFTFSRVPAGLSSTPTLSAMARSDRPVTATVTLSYLAQGFDWAADYTAVVGADGARADLGAWITLANGNGVSLPNAQTQIVAGRLNRVYEQPWIDPAPRVIAQCWPRGTTSDIPAHGDIDLVHPYGFGQRPGEEADEVIVAVQKRGVRLQYAPMAAPAPPPPPPPPEQLGDLKLYRAPRLTTIAARESKQTRLLEQPGVAFERIYQADLWASAIEATTQAQTILRGKNDAAHKLGLPLPAGHVVVYQDTARGRLLAGETNLSDTAEGEDVELKLGLAPDLQVRQTGVAVVAKPAEVTAPTPRVRIVRLPAAFDETVKVTNASAHDVAFELRLQINPGARVTSHGQAVALKDGRPIFRLNVPAGGEATVTYRVE